jgi:1,2-diacylglycerol 3-alpha-glucosyltransferase
VKICMFTNTFTPHLGGVAHSVATVASELRRQGHRVVIVCPEFPAAPRDEVDVVRVPAVQRFNGTDFSVALPVAVGLRAYLTELQPDIIHSHHPFLLGDTAMRIAAELIRPIVFTHHTFYERYTHYVPADSATLRRFVIELGRGYGNLCGRVIAPSESVARVLVERGLETPVEVIPTGVVANNFRGDGGRGRMAAGIPRDCPVVGHVGRLAPEKNLLFLARSVERVIARRPEVHFLVIGAGPSSQDIETIFERAGLRSRLVLRGALTGDELADGYAAMDLFAFASTSETQGLVLMEALLSGIPVVALAAPGARDVVADGVNGALIEREDEGLFAAALESWLGRVREMPEAIRAAAQQSATPYRIEATTAHLVRLYSDVIATAAPPTAIDLSGWSSLLRRAEAEWSLWANIARSAAHATNVNGGIVARQQRLRLLERLRASRRSTRGDLPGLVLVQIDGLSRRELERALLGGRMPFLRRLLHRGGYGLVSHYSGLPSTTPAVQGELFYGTPGCVPAFEFFDRARGELVRMFFKEPASRVESRLAATGLPLLRGGSSYSNIFGGGSEYPWCCAARSELAQWVRLDDPVRTVTRGLAYALNAARLGGLSVIETVLGLGDCLRGGLSGFPWRLEALYIPTRVAIGIVIRELITIGAILDARRGTPIIHLNYLGYDEQAHRRGPQSAFAHWALKGIDRSIERIAGATGHSRKRTYEVWIYSDHGQEETLPFRLVHGRSLAETVAALLGRRVVTPPAFASETIELLRGARMRQGGLLDMSTRRSEDVVVSAMGPLGHLYVGTPLAPDELIAACQRLSGEGGVPLVFCRIGGQVWGWRDGKRGTPRRDSGLLFGEQHPFLKHVSEDMERLCRHPDAGDIVVSGWRVGAPPLSFVDEWGAHGGPGERETHGFAILPERLSERAAIIRPADLRMYAGEFQRGRRVGIERDGGVVRAESVGEECHGTPEWCMVPLTYLDDCGVRMVVLLTLVAIAAGILSYGAADPSRSAFLQIVAVTSLACAIVLGVASRWGKKARKPAAGAAASSERR